MVWSEGNPYPFNIYDLNGELIMSVAIDGITLYSPGSLDILVRMGLLDSPNFSGYGLSVIDDNFDHVESVVEASGLRVYSLPPARPFLASGGLLVQNPAGLQDDQQPNMVLLAPRLGNNTPWLELFGQSYDLSKGSLVRTSIPADTTYTGLEHEYQGFMHEGKYVAGVWTREVWKTLTLLNGWVGVAGLIPQYRLMVDGTVQMRGCMTGGTTAAATQIGQLDVGYRPGQTYRFITAEQATGNEFRHVAVQPSGILNIFNCLTANICIDGIRFSVI